MEHVLAIREGTIFTPNQTSNLDAFAMLKALPPPARPRLAIVFYEEFYHAPRKRPIERFKKWLVFNLFTLGINVVPLPHTRNPRKSLEHLADRLRHGHHVLIFPEGWVTHTGEMGSFKPGAALLASMSGAPVIPVHIDGLFEVLPSPRIIPRRGRARVRFGAPLHFGNETREAFTRRLEKVVRQLGRPPAETAAANSQETVD